MRPAADIVVEPVGADLVALAQAHALDASTFPHMSLPVVLGGDAPPSLFVARAERGGPVIGFAALREIRGVLEIAGIAVEPAHRRRGVARRLLRAAVRSAPRRGVDHVALHVSTALSGAIALYESEGFVRRAKLHGYYSTAHFANGGDAWRMTRDV